MVPSLTSVIVFTELVIYNLALVFASIPLYSEGKDVMVDEYEILLTSIF